MKIPDSFNQPFAVAYPTAHKVLSWFGRALIALSLYSIFTGLHSTIFSPRDPGYLVKASEQISFLTFKLVLVSIAFLIGLIIVAKEMRHRVGLTFLGWQVMQFASGAFNGLDNVRLGNISPNNWFHLFLCISFLPIGMYAVFNSNLTQNETS